MIKMLDDELSQRIKSDFDTASRRIIFLDYDGTLVPFASCPDAALPGRDLIHILEELSSNDQNTIVIISGRDRKFLDNVFGNMNITLVAEHGFFIRRPEMSWRAELLIENHWKTRAWEVLSRFCELFTGSFVEEKETALAWHYRNCSNQPTSVLIVSLKLLLEQFTEGFNTEILEGNKVVEVREKFITKGSAACELLQGDTYNFILAIGDDITDEDLFRAIPSAAYSIKVGSGSTHAKYFCSSQENVAGLLTLLLEQPSTEKK